jgi:BirA family biotin operon repressor/biotin-[acetyl-CoA-carboxylase] ligase
VSATPLLQALARGETVSGTALAQRLGVSRAAVWKQVERVRALGLDVEAVAGRGYRLARAIEWLSADAIVAALPGRRRAAVEVVFEVDSTSSELLRRARGDAPSGSVLLAERQTAGRGRRGRQWESPLGANVYLSLLWRCERGLAAMAGLSIAAGVAVQRALQSLDVGGTALKWPNDVVAGARKLAGVLVEVGGEWSGQCHAVIGVGLNHAMPAGAAARIAQPWTDLHALCAGAPPSRDAVAAALIGAFDAVLAQFGREGLAPFIAAWRRHDALAGVEIQLDEGGRRWNGRAQGIDAAGRLRVRLPDGTLRAVGSAEVSVRRRAR